MRIWLFELASLHLAVNNCSVITRCLCRWLLFQMNPVVVLFLALNSACVIGFPMERGAEWKVKDSSPASTSGLTLLHPRTRSLPYFPSAIGNDHPAIGKNEDRGVDHIKHGLPLSAAGPKKSGISKNGAELDVMSFLDKKWNQDGSTVSGSIEGPESPISTTTPPATVDIKTLPGYWLKDPKVEPSSWHMVDYRTERYRLDDLLVMTDSVKESKTN